MKTNRKANRKRRTTITLTVGKKLPTCAIQTNNGRQVIIESPVVTHAGISASAVMEWVDPIAHATSHKHKGTSRIDPMAPWYVLRDNSGTVHCVQPKMLFAHSGVSNKRYLNPDV